MQTVITHNRSSWIADPLKCFEQFISSPAYAKTSFRHRVNDQLSEASRTVYIAMFSRFITYMKSRGVDLFSMSAEDIFSFLTATNDSDQGKQFILDSDIQNRYLRLLERVFTHLELSPRPTDNLLFGPLKDNYKLRGRNQETIALTPTEIHEFLTALPVPTAKDRPGRLSANWKKRRDRALQCTVLGAGLTVAEVISLRTDSIDQITGIDGSIKITVEDTSDYSEADQQHVTYMHRELAPELLSWLDEHGRLFGDNTLVFPGTNGQPLDKATVYRQIRKTFETAGIDLPRRGGRTLRNTFAVRELRSGVDTEEVIEKLGLFEPRSLEIYEIAAGIK